MTLDGWLIIDIALGIVVGDVLRVMLKDTQEWWKTVARIGSKVVDAKAAEKKRTADETTAKDKEAEDWNFLWTACLSRQGMKCANLLKTNNCGSRRKN